MNETPKHLTNAKLKAHTQAALGRNIGWAIALLTISLLVGMLGYREFAGMRWVDAFLNASMLLGGMGPVGDLPNDEAKVFAGIYAMYCGVVFIATAGLLILPLANHVLHKFHLDHKEQ